MSELGGYPEVYKQAAIAFEAIRIDPCGQMDKER